jgi:hypothetical protein
MPTKTIEAILDFFEDSLGDLLIVASVLLFLVAVLFFTPFYQWVSGLAFFFGAVLLISGLAIRLEGPLTLTTPSRSGLGTILICVSLVAFASAVICIIFAVPSGFTIFRIRSEGAWFQGIHLNVAEPLSWLFMPLITIGLGLLVVGALLKFHGGL